LKKGRERVKANKDKVYAAYGGYICACCKETEPDFLSIDHINNDGALHRKSLFGTGKGSIHGWLIKNNYPPGFQVLCMNCQIGKAKNNGVCPHQKGNTTLSCGSNTFISSESNMDRENVLNA
jgi:hypothetical protein